MTQPEALRLADEMERVAEYDHQVQAAAELRRLYQANLDLLSELYVLRASKHLRDVTAMYKKIAEGNEMSLDAMKLALRALENPWEAGAEGVADAIIALRAAIDQAQPDARAHHKMMIAMIKEHWRSIDLQWKGDPELCHAMGYEAGYNDAVAPRVEPPVAESGAGFESLPASPKWQGLTEDERARFRQLGFVGVEIVEAALKERNS